MTLKLHKTIFQCVVAFGALIPILTGLAGLILGPSMVAGMTLTPVSFDSHFHYLSGLLLGIGLGYWSTLSHIELKTERFQVLTGIVMVGGLGRAVSWYVSGPPDHAMMFGFAMELVVTPLLAFWQFRLARHYAATRVD